MQGTAEANTSLRPVTFDPGGATWPSTGKRSHSSTGAVLNCAHPTHFAHVLTDDEPWVHRIRGLRANASRMSHVELNESATLDVGNPTELGTQYADLKVRLPMLNVMGGCCGTDHRHVEAITEACLPLFRAVT